MKITEIKSRERTTVLWLGEAPPVSTISLLARLRYYVQVEAFSAAAAQSANFASAAAVVFYQPPSRPHAWIKEALPHLRTCLDCGAIPFVICHAIGANVVFALEESGIPRAAYNGASYPPLPHVILFPPQTPYQAAESTMAEVISKYSSPYSAPVEAAGVFEIKGEALDSLADDDRLLLRRAFFDCSSVTLRPIVEGNSAARVYVAHRILRESHLGAHPQSFFVKLSSRKKALSEWASYVGLVHPNLPFHLAPRLSLERCAVGATKGILVGDFVEDSESLTDCSNSARASTPIATLFDKTLRAWRYDATAETSPVGLSKAVSWLLLGTIPEARQVRAKAMGLKRDIGDLRAALEQRCKRHSKEEFLWGRVHGDMHANNVRIRATDAILIDFQSSNKGPVLIDPATLDVSLAIRAPAATGFDSSAWLRVMKQIYCGKAVASLPEVPDPTEKYSWIAACIRQLRLHALYMERTAGQYAFILALRLYAAATKDLNAGEDEQYRRAAALVLSETLLDET